MGAPSCVTVRSTSFNVSKADRLPTHIGHPGCSNEGAPCDLNIQARNDVFHATSATCDWKNNELQWYFMIFYDILQLTFKRDIESITSIECSGDYEAATSVSRCFKMFRVTTPGTTDQLDGQADHDHCRPSLLVDCWGWCILFVYTAVHTSRSSSTARSAVAEVSRIGHSRRGELLWCMDGRANPLMDRKVMVIFGVAVVTSHTTAGCSVV